MATGTGSKGIEEYIDKRCVVTFRPIKGWNGEYGFDWWRDGDFAEFDGKTKVQAEYGESVNFEYKNMGSTHYRDMNFKSQYVGRYFEELHIKHSDSKTADSYIVPYVFFKENENITLQLIIKFENQSSLKLHFESRNQILFSHKPDDLIVTDSKTIEIKFRANKIRSSDVLYVYSINPDDMNDKKLAGKLMIVDNQPYTIKCKIVKVLVEGGAQKSFKPTSISDKKLDDSVSRILSQTGISTIHDPKDSVSINFKPETSSNRYDKIFIKTEEKDKFADLFVTRDDIYDSQDNMWKIRVFFINLRCATFVDGTLQPLGGFFYQRKEDKNIKLPSIFIFAHSRENDIYRTFAHELLHALGLKHSFENLPQPEYPCNPQLRFIFDIFFEKRSTNNLMDYVPQGTILWKWQWDIVRKYAKQIEENKRKSIFNKNRVAKKLSRE